MKTKTIKKYLRKMDKYNKIKIPKSVQQKCEKDFLELKIQTEDQEKCFIASVNEKITIRKQIREQLEVQVGDVLAVEFNKVERAGRTEQLFKNGKVDLLSLVPEKTSKGYEIIVSEFETESDVFLRIWSPGGTKGARQIEIKRFVDKRALGEILGQYQAEGEKSGEISRVVFTNKLVKEHRDFIRNLESFGLDRRSISIQCVYNEELISEKEAASRCEGFEQSIGIEVEKFVSYNRSKGPLAFRTKIYSVLFAEILFDSLSVLRKNISQEINHQNDVLGKGFLAKLLTGDGTLDTTISSARTYGSPSINVRIVDQDLSALKDYKAILSNFGFQPFISKKHIYTRSSCSLENLIFLYKIRAFRGTRNWQQMHVTIALILRGRRYKTYKRFIDFLDVEKISSNTIIDNYDVSRKAANEWLKNKSDENLLVLSRSSPYPKIYSLSDSGKDFAICLESILASVDKIKKEKEVKGHQEALEALKDDVRR